VFIAPVDDSPVSAVSLVSLVSLVVADVVVVVVIVEAVVVIVVAVVDIVAELVAALESDEDAESESVAVAPTDVVSLVSSPQPTEQQRPSEIRILVVSSMFILRGEQVSQALVSTSSVAPCVAVVRGELRRASTISHLRSAQPRLSQSMRGGRDLNGVVFEPLRPPWPLATRG
jgi:hypothetical protein